MTAMITREITVLLNIYVQSTMIQTRAEQNAFNVASMPENAPVIRAFQVPAKAMQSRIPMRRSANQNQLRLTDY